MISRPSIIKQHSTDYVIPAVCMCDMLCTHRHEFFARLTVVSIRMANRIWYTFFMFATCAQKIRRPCKGDSVKRAIRVAYRCMYCDDSSETSSHAATAHRVLVSGSRGIFVSLGLFLIVQMATSKISLRKTLRSSVIPSVSLLFCIQTDLSIKFYDIHDRTLQHYQ